MSNKYNKNDLQGLAIEIPKCAPFIVPLYCRNLDPLTETYGLSFYMQYLAHWPEYFQVAESPSGEIMGYGKRICQ